MTQKSGPFAAGAGFSLGQDDMIDILGPMLQGDGVNTTNYGGSTVQVYGNSSGLQVFVRAGSACSRGLMYSSTADVPLTITANSSGSARIDRVVLRNDRGHAGGGQVTPVVITGTPSSTPVAPAYQQNVGGIWDFPLAQVRVSAGAVTIAPGDVSDERLYIPLHIDVCDTSIPLFTPRVDGSDGRVFYDKNPAVLDLIVTNGSTWTTLRSADTGWSTISVPFFQVIQPVQWRIRDGHVYWRGVITKVTSEESPDVGVAASSLAVPGWSGDAAFFPVTCVGPTGTPEGGWSALLRPESGDVRLRIAGPAALFQRYFSFQFSYLLG